MPKPLRSEFKTTGRPDTPTNLASGSEVITTTLTRDLSADDRNCVSVVNGGKADMRGVLLIDDEVIFYHDYHQNVPDEFPDLLRGQRDTVPALHLAGATVTIIGRPKFDNPAVPQAVIAAQEEIVTLRGQITQLEARLTALENRP